MRKKVSATHLVAGMLGTALVAVSGSAAADTCPSDSTTVFVSGSSAFLPVMQAVAGVLGNSVKIVYQKPGSCQGMQDLVGDNGSAVPQDTTAPSVLPSSGAAAVGCTMPSGVTGYKIDIGLSDVYAQTCASTYDTNLNTVGASTSTKDFLGPIQAMTIAVPSNSSENAISAEAAYMVFRFGADTAAHTITPWNLSNDIYVRFWDSGTLEMIGSAIGLPGGKWLNATNKGSSQTQSSAGNMATALNTAANTNASATIGILAEQNLIAGLKPLAFQATGQACSYFPDSSSTAHDKINVRQGRYAIWGPEHLVTNVDSSGKPIGENGNTAAVQTVMNALLATSQAPAASSGGDAGGASSLTEAQVATLIGAISTPTIGIVPQCAMQVSRESEIGAEASYVPPAACSCAFEIASDGHAANGHTCTPCTAANAATTCTGATPTCHFGYCEAE